MKKMFLFLTLLFGTLSVLCGLFWCAGCIGSIMRKMKAVKKLVIYKIRESLPDELEISDDDLEIIG